MLNWLAKLLLFPLSVLFGLGVRLRRWLYRHHFLGSAEFDVPVISVGNLSVGGTGKTPMTEWLIRTISPAYRVGVISRGYGRTTRGFIRVHVKLQASQAGDEPLLLKLKYRQTEVAVGEARVIAIPRLLTEAPELKVILLDDGYQHLSVRPQVNILLTSYERPFWKDHLLPMGTLREEASASARAHILIVTKCPDDLDAAGREACLRQIRPKPGQKVFFSGLRYGRPYLLFGGEASLEPNEKLVLLTGIANAAPLVRQLSAGHELLHFEFGDHHLFREFELARIAGNYPDQRHWITTEKDAVRLIPFRQWFVQQGITLWVQPVEVYFLPGPEGDPAQLIREYLAFYYPERVENGPAESVPE